MAGELVVTTGARRPVQKQRLAGGWTPTRREAFLDHVAATCNVRAACDGVGLSQASVYALRRRDPAFAEQWRMALLSGYDRLEGELLRGAVALLDGVAVGDPALVIAPPITVDQAIKLLDRHRAMIERTGVVTKERQHRATQEETDAMLSERLRQLRAKRKGRA